jgi:hypothetical protein
VGAKSCRGWSGGQAGLAVSSAFQRQNWLSLLQNTLDSVDAPDTRLAPKGGCYVVVAA